MDKEEFRIKLEEINNLVEKKDYEGALLVVDSIDWRRVKNVRTLCIVGEIYAANKRYEDSREIFLLAYHRAPIGKNILNRLIEISLKMGDVEEAQEYFTEFEQVAGDDSILHILKYKIQTERKDPIEERIKSLEEYKEKEFVEKWSYELAKLYYQSGRKSDCENLCDEMVLWFNEGPYVAKAKELKERLAKPRMSLRDDTIMLEGTTTGEKKSEEGALSSAAEEEPVKEDASPNMPQEHREETLEEIRVREEEEEEEEELESGLPDEAEENQIESINVSNVKEFSGETISEKLSKGLRDIFGTRRDDDIPEEEDDVISVPDEMIKELGEDEVPSEESQEEEADEPESTIDRSKEKPAPVRKEEVVPEEKEEKEEQEEIEEKQEEEKKPEETKPEEEEEELLPKSDMFSGDFNLEDTILAAASLQGIEIPGEGQEKKEEEEEKLEAPEPGSALERLTTAVEKGKGFVGRAQTEDFEGDLGDTKDISRQLEEEGFLSEEDLAEAEKEFFPESEKKEKPQVNFDELLKEQMKEDDDLEKKKGTSSWEVKVPKSKVAEKIVEDYTYEEIGDEPEEEEEELSEDEELSEEDGLSEEEELEEEEEDYEEEEELSPEELALRRKAELEEFLASLEKEKKPVDIVPRDKRLSEEEMRLFSYFTKVPGMKEQLLDTLIHVQEAAADKTSRYGNIIVMGGQETGKTRLISSLIPAICHELNLEATKVAYVFAEDINGKDIPSIVEKLSGGFLVIESANNLDAATAQKLNDAMEEETEGMIVILEDEKISMRKMIARYPKLARKFTSMINIPIFTNDELVNFAQVYTLENGYRIDQMGMLALYNLIGESQKEDEPMNIGAVKKLLDDAFAKAGGILKLNRKKRLDKDGYIVLHEKDFS